MARRCTPPRRRQAADAYTIVDSANAALGGVLVAAKARGVCAVAMGSSDAELRARCSANSPPRDRRDAGALAHWTRAISRTWPDSSRRRICRSIGRRRQLVEVGKELE